MPVKQEDDVMPDPKCINQALNSRTVIQQTVLSSVAAKSFLIVYK